MRPVVVFLGWLCKATHRIYARLIAREIEGEEHLQLLLSTLKRWQISIPQQPHQPQAQVGDVGNQRERHK